MAHGPQQAIGIHNTNINRLQSTCARISELGLTKITFIVAAATLRGYS